MLLGIDIYILYGDARLFTAKLSDLRKGWMRGRIGN